MRHVILFIFLFFILFGQVSVETQLSKRTVRVGDQLTLIISANCPEGKSVKFNELTPESDAMTVLNEEISPESITYTIVFWEVGEFQIPGVSVDILNHGQLESTLITDPESVVVESIVNEQNAEIRGIKGMHDIELYSPYRKYLLLFGVILSAAALWLIFRKRKISVVKAEKWQKPKDSPRVHAKKRLETLECPYPVTDKSCEIFYLKLTSILKEYLENEFFFKAMEMTTEEIHRYLESTINDDKLIRDTYQILSSSDMAKFARQIPGRENFENDKVKIGSIIDSFHQKIEDDFYANN